MLVEDDNEKVLPQTCKTVIGGYLNSQKIDYRREIMEVGDYTDDDNNFIVERKHMWDWYSSILDGRLPDQLYRISQQVVGYKAIIFVGDWYYFLEEVEKAYGYPLKQLCLSWRYKCRNFGVEFIECIDDITAAKEILSISYFSKELDKAMTILPTNYSRDIDLRKTIMMMFPEIGSIKKVNLLLKKYKNLYNIITECITNSKEMIKTLRGTRIGPKTINFIIDIFTSTKEVTGNAARRRRNAKKTSGTGIRFHAPSKRKPKNGDTGFYWDRKNHKHNEKSG